MHDGRHLPRMNEGPVIKSNCNQRYATSGATAARFRRICEAAEIPYQEFVNRADLPCGSTIGAIASAGLGIDTVDVGNAMWAMHSLRETVGVQDLSLMQAAMDHFFLER